MNLIQSYNKDGRTIELFQKERVFIIKDNKSDELNNVTFLNQIIASNAFNKYIEDMEVANELKVSTGI